jgi:hypothetical protein
MNRIRAWFSHIAAEEAPHREGQKPINPLIILILAIPVSGLYVVRVLLTGESLEWSVVGYIATGLAFGLGQSLFYVRRRYLVAFFSTASIPLLAYIVLGGLMILYGLNILLFGNDWLSGLSGYGVEIVNIPLATRIGQGLGVILFAIVLSVLVIPFGLIGIGGRFLGDELLPRFSRHLIPKASREWSTPNIEYLMQLNRVIADYFTLEDIRTLCFELGIDYEDVPGDSKSDKIRELLIYTYNRGLVSKLAARVQQHRPEVTLPAYPAAEQADKVSSDLLRQQIDQYEQAATRGVVYMVLLLAALLVVIGVIIAILPTLVS